MTAFASGPAPRRPRWRQWRPGRDRTTGFAAVGIVGALVATAVVLGAGAGGSVARLADVGSWLGDSGNGTVVHVNGLTGGVDGWVHLDSSGHPMKISQGPDGVLVVDQTTGLVSRIDPAQLTVAQTQDFGQTGLEVFDDGKQAFLVDAATGTVQLVDAPTLSVKGRSLSLQAPLGHPGLDSSGTLWIPLGDGTLVPVSAGDGSTPAAGAPVKVGAPNDPLALTIAAGTPIVTDARSGSVTVLGVSGGRLSVQLPPAAVQAAGKIVAPDTADTPIVPVLAEGDGTLVLVDTAHGSLSAVRVDAGSDQLEAPQTLGGKVYIPDDTRGTLIVYDTASGSFENQITVTGHQGQLRAQVRDGLLWVDDQAGDQALVIGPDGVARPVNKAAPGGPAPSTATSQQTATSQPSKTSGQTASTAATSPTATSADDTTSASAPDTTQSDTPPAPPSQTPSRPVPSSPARPTGGRTTSKPTPTPPSTPSSSLSPSSTPSTPAPPPLAPGTPTATSGPGTITVTFPPARGGGAPANYTLQGAPPGATVTPSQVPATGPYSFTVTGGTCASTYSFTVTANYPTGAKVSTPSVAVRPCTAPSAPSQFTGKAVNHGASLSWSAANGNGGIPTYSIKGPGASSIRGTSATISKLTNFTTATFELTATTPAGSSNPAKVVSVPITGPTYDATAYNDKAGSFEVRDAPNTKDAPIGSFPKGSGAGIVVICQVANGEIIYDKTVWPGSSNIWDKVQYNGRTAYIAGIYVSTPNVTRGQYTKPDTPKIWPCT